MTVSSISALIIESNKQFYPNHYPRNCQTVFGDMMSASPCPSAAHHAVDEVLFGDDDDDVSDSS